MPHVGRAAGDARTGDARGGNPPAGVRADADSSTGESRAARALQAPAPTHPAAAHPARSAPPPPRRHRAATTQAATRDGYFTVDSMPYATIYVDGTRRGVTPLLRLPLAPGRHRIVAVTADKRRQSLSITIEAGVEARRRRLVW